MCHVAGPRVIASIALAIAAAGCGPSEEQAAFEARKIALVRRIRGVNELVAEAEKGSLIPTDRFFVGVDEKLVADLFRSQLPLEQPLEDRFVVRLESAEMQFRDKYGAVRIAGRIHPKAFPSRSVALRIDGGLGAAEIDPATGILRVAIAIDHIEVAEAAGLEGMLGGGVIRYLGAKGREILQDAIPAIEVPVKLSQSARCRRSKRRACGSARSKCRSTCRSSACSQPAESSGSRSTRRSAR